MADIEVMNVTGLGLLKRAEALASKIPVQDTEEQFNEELSEDDLFQMAGGTPRPIRH